MLCLYFRRKLYQLFHVPVASCHLVLCLCLLRSLKVLVSYAAQCPLLVYQQYLQKIHHRLICFHCHHTRHNVRYKGNISNTSVIIFLNNYFSHFVHLPFYALRKLNKTPSDGTLLGRTTSRFL